MSAATYEYESLHEMEGEEEWGDILGGIAKGIGGLLGEGEFEDEFESEFEDEWSHETEFEFEHESEAEAEQFFGALANLAQRAIKSPAIRQIALNGAKAALTGMGAPGAAGAIGQVASLLSESEGEFEFESELNPVRKVYPDAMMEHFAHEAAEAENEGEAFAFLAPLVPLAAKAMASLAPKAIGALAKSTPHLVRGLTNVGKALYRTPGAKPLMRTMPTIAKKAVANIARQATHGRQVTPQSAVKTLARTTAQVLGSPKQSVHAYQRSRALDRKFHAQQSPAAKIQAHQIARTKRIHPVTGRPYSVHPAPGRHIAGVHPHSTAGHRPHPVYGTRPHHIHGRHPGYRARYVGGTPGRYVAGAPRQYRVGTPGRAVSGTAGRYVGGMPGRYIGGTPRPYAGGAPVRPIAARPGGYIGGAPGYAPRPRGHSHGHRNACCCRSACSCCG